MSHKNPAGLVSGLIAEIAVVAAVVAILPKVPLGQAAAMPGREIADEKPSLVPRPEPLLPPVDNWRTAVSRPNLPREISPANPEYVEQRLDKAGQQLVSGVAVYLSQQAEALLQPTTRPGVNQRDDVAPRFTAPSNSFRY
jgi:hypothetical protein